MAEPGEPLSEREQAVLERLAAGSTNREIAQNLNISPNTVKVHVRNIFTKLGVSSRTEATTVAIKRGLLAVPGAETGPATDTDDRAPDETGLDEDLEVELPEESEPEAGSSRPWRIIVVVLVLAAGLLLVGALASAWLLGNGADATPTTEVESAGEPFEEKQLGDSNWFTGTLLPQERANMAVASVGLDLYLIGGEVEAGVVNLVDVYETSDGRWQTGASKPTAVSDATAAVLFGEIYVPGGRLADGRPTAVVEAYSPANDAWRPVEPLPSQVAGGLALSDGNRLYLLGGWDGDGYLAGGYVYDPAANTWQSLPPMPTARAQAAGDVAGDRLFVIGGSDGRQDLDVCETFDLTDGAWSTCANMALARVGAGASAQGSGLLYVIGGGKEGGDPQAEVYDVQGDSWSQVDMPMLEAGASWRDLGVVSVETRIYVLGGRQDQHIVDDNYTFVPFVHRTFLPSVGGDS